MMEARPDWVLSRQRAWGVPLTCFTKKGRVAHAMDFLLRNAEVNARVAMPSRLKGPMRGIRRGQRAVPWRDR